MRVWSGGPSADLAPVRLRDPRGHMRAMTRTISYKCVYAQYRIDENTHLALRGSPIFLAKFVRWVHAHNLHKAVVAPIDGTAKPLFSKARVFVSKILVADISMSERID